MPDDSIDIERLYVEITEIKQNLARIDERTAETRSQLDELQVEVDELNTKTERNTYGIAVGSALVASVSAWAVNNISLSGLLAGSSVGTFLLIFLLV